MKVIMYKSTDGKLHESASLCDAHNAQIAVIPALKSCLSANCKFDESTGLVSTDDVIDWAFKNAVQLIDILTPLVPHKPRVTRKSKKNEAVKGADAANTDQSGAGGHA